MLANPRALILRLAQCALGGAVTLCLVSCATPASDSADVLARSAGVMGTAQVDTVRIDAHGTGWTFGQAYDDYQTVGGVRFLMRVR